MRQARREAAAWLASQGVDSPDLSARLLIQHVCGGDESLHFMEPHRLLQETEAAALRDLVSRRGLGEPAAYLLGIKEFFGHDLAVGPGCLVPRPETELVVEQALAAFPRGVARFADLGAGSGCLAVALGLAWPEARGVAAELSPSALPWTRRNLASHGLASRVALLRADFSRLPLADASLDCVVANPPYVSPAEFAALGREVKDFEPATALTPLGAPPGDDGLADLRRLAPEAARVMRPGALFLCEIGWLQAEGAARILEGEGAWRDVAVLRDLAGLDRVVRAWRSA